MIFYCHRLTRFVSILLSVALVLTSLSLPDVARASASAAPPSEILNKIHLSPELGAITDSFGLRVASFELQQSQGVNPQPVTRNSKRVILIQDLHLHYPTQKRILKILDRLFAKGWIQGPIAIEGLEGPYDTSRLASISPSPEKEKLVDYFMQKGELSGDEAFAVLRGESHRLYGADDGQLYQLNRELYKATRPNRKALQARLTHIQNEITLLKKAHYNRALRKLDRTEVYDVASSEDLLKKKLAVAKSLRASESGSKEETLVENIICVDHDLVFLTKLLRQEMTLEEVRYIAQRLPQFVELTDRLLTLQRSVEKNSHPSLPLPLRERVQGEGTPLIRPTGTFSRGGEKESVTLQKSDLEETLKASIDFYAVALMRDKPLAEHALALLGQSSEFRVPGLGLKDKNLPTPQLETRNPKPETVVLVAGGFHTAGITQEFKKAGVSYVVITPKIEEVSEEYQALYDRRLAGEALTVEEVAKDFGLSGAEVVSFKIQAHPPIPAQTARVNSHVMTAPEGVPVVAAAERGILNKGPGLKRWLGYMNAWGGARASGSEGQKLLPVEWGDDLGFQLLPRVGILPKGAAVEDLKKRAIYKENTLNAYTVRSMLENAEREFQKLTGKALRWGAIGFHAATPGTDGSYVAAQRHRSDIVFNRNRMKILHAIIEQEEESDYFEKSSRARAAQALFNLDYLHERGHRGLGRINNDRGRLAMKGSIVAPIIALIAVVAANYGIIEKNVLISALISIFIVSIPFHVGAAWWIHDLYDEYKQINLEYSYLQRVRDQEEPDVRTAMEDILKNPALNDLKEHVQKLSGMSLQGPFGKLRTLLSMTLSSLAVSGSARASAAAAPRLQQAIMRSYPDGTDSILQRAKRVDVKVLKEGESASRRRTQIVERYISDFIHWHALAAFRAWMYSAVNSPVGKFGDKVATAALDLGYNTLPYRTGPSAAEGKRDSAETVEGDYGLPLFFNKLSEEIKVTYGNDPVEVTERLQRQNYLANVSIASYALHELYKMDGKRPPTLNLPDQVYMFGVLGPLGSAVDINLPAESFVEENMRHAATARGYENNDIKKVRMTGLLIRERHTEIINDALRLLGVQWNNLPDDLKPFFAKRTAHGIEAPHLDDNTATGRFRDYIKKKKGGQVVFKNQEGGSMKMVTDGDLMPVMEIVNNEADLAMGAGGVAEAMIKVRMGFPHIEFVGKIISYLAAKDGNPHALQVTDPDAEILRTETVKTKKGTEETIDEIDLARKAGLEVTTDANGKARVKKRFLKEDLAGGSHNLTIATTPLGDPSTKANNYVPQLKEIEILEGGREIKTTSLVVEPSGRVLIVPIIYETGLRQLDEEFDKTQGFIERARLLIEIGKLYGDLKMYKEAQKAFKDADLLLLGSSHEDLKNRSASFKAYYEGMEEILTNPEPNRDLAREKFLQAEKNGNRLGRMMLQVINDEKATVQAALLPARLNEVVRAKPDKREAATGQFLQVLQTGGVEELPTVRLLLNRLAQMPEHILEEVEVAGLVDKILQAALKNERFGAEAAQLLARLFRQTIDRGFMRAIARAGLSDSRLGELIKSPAGIGNGTKAIVGFLIAGIITILSSLQASTGSIEQSGIVGAILFLLIIGSGFMFARSALKLGLEKLQGWRASRAQQKDWDARFADPELASSYAAVGLGRNPGAPTNSNFLRRLIDKIVGNPRQRKEVNGDLATANNSIFASA